jgi:diguanylate cyclase (GGDEF)-like protein
LSEFLHRLLADAPLADVLASLTRSITATLHGLGAAVHHGFDGERFVGVTGSWDGAAGLPLVGAPWVDAVGAKGVLQATADHDSAASLGATSCWLTPISVTSLPPAVLSVWTHLREAPLLGHRNALAEAAGYVELALVRTAEHQRLLHLAGHDSLTGVANRASFLDRLAEDLAIGEADLAVAFCDLDGFKQINDSYGHGTGDDVLVQVADRLRATLRAGDELARMGGDEFTVVWRGVSDEVAAEQVAQRLLAAVREPFTVPHGTVKLGLSVGIALATPGATADSLLSAADTALYQSKKAGGARSTIRR